MVPVSGMDKAYNKIKQSLKNKFDFIFGVWYLLV